MPKLSHAWKAGFELNVVLQFFNELSFGYIN